MLRRDPIASAPAKFRVLNRLAPIQENRMILKAIADGVSEEAIAKALNVSPKTIRDSRSQLTDTLAFSVRCARCSIEYSRGSSVFSSFTNTETFVRVFRRAGRAAE